MQGKSYKKIVINDIRLYDYVNEYKANHLEDLHKMP